MATSTYGTIRPADVLSTDIEIFYTFTPSRDQIPTTPTQIDSNLIQPVTITPTNSSVNRVMGGLYNLTLPKNIFSTKGFYNIYIRPREVETIIIDCGVLSNLPNVKGIVLDSNRPEVQSLVNAFRNGGLSGYRIEYLDNNFQRIPNLFRIVTSANRCEAVSQNLNNVNDKTIRYRFNDSGTLVFITLTPSSENSVKANSKPFLGEPNQRIIISNTFFTPIHVEIEMTDVTLDVIGDILLGNQAKSKNGIYTIYDRDTNDIKYQFDIYDIKDEFTKDSLFEVRERKTAIDLTQDFENIKNFNNQ